jgi:hypothetical protein
MELACRLYHAHHPDAPSEVVAYPHLELLSSDDHERWKLKVVADQLRDFGAIPYSYKEVTSADGATTCAVLRVALYERQGAAAASESPARSSTA